jgi:hypothetical protein
MDCREGRKEGSYTLILRVVVQLGRGMGLRDGKDGWTSCSELMEAERALHGLVLIVLQTYETSSAEACRFTPRARWR